MKKQKENNILNSIMNFLLEIGNPKSSEKFNLLYRHAKWTTCIVYLDMIWETEDENEMSRDMTIPEINDWFKAHQLDIDIVETEREGEYELVGPYGDLKRYIYEHYCIDDEECAEMHIDDIEPIPLA